MHVVEDMLGRKVEVPVKVNKVVGLRAGALRFLVYMDATDMVAGIEEGELRGSRPYIMAHPSLLDLPLIGPSMGGDAELIVKAQPDVIFIAYATSSQANNLQKKTGIPVIAIACPEFLTGREKMYGSFRLIGKVLDKANRADSLISYINHTINTLNERTGNIVEKAKPSVYIGGVSYSGSYGISSTQPYYPPFAFINANNVAASIDDRLVSHVKGTHVDKEKLVTWNPDILFFDASGLSLVKKDIGQGSALFNSLKAVKNNRMYTLLPYNNYATNYELVLANAWYAGKVLYPEVFSDISVKEKTNEILMVFLNQKFYDKLIKTSKGFMKVSVE